MLQIRTVRHVLTRRPTVEGAGVRLHRVFGQVDPELDPFLLFAGKPLREPVAWYGPVVMTTEEELETAFRAVRAGTFVREAPVARDEPR